MSDAAVERLARIVMGGGDPCEGSIEDATNILDALPDLLREDSEAGEALRERLGLEWEREHDALSWRRLVGRWVTP